MWFDCTKTALKKMKVAYNNYSLRRLMKLPWRNSVSEMFANLNIRSFDEMLRIFTFMSRVIAFNNVVISSIYNSPCRLFSNIWTWWDSILHSNRAKLYTAYSTSIDFYHISYNLFIGDVDIICIIILLIVFIQCILSFL